MKNEIIEISPDELFKNFENDSIENSFIASDNLDGSSFLKDIVFHNNKVSDILSFPFRAEEAIIIVGLEGHMKANLQIGDYMLGKNSLLAILPKQVFEIKEISPDFRTIVFIMKPSFWDTNDNVPETMQLLQYFSREKGILLSQEVVNEIEAIYQLIKSNIDRKGLFSRQIIQYYIKILFFSVYAFINAEDRQKASASPPTKEYVFEKFIQLVERHFKEHHDLAFYAGQLHLSGKYLSTLVRSVSGRTAGQWIRAYLIMEARALLKSDKMTIQQVSNELCFHDQSHFGVFFKKHVGCSPREYQKM